MGRPINSILKSQFEEVYSEAINNAEEHFKMDFLKKIEGFDHFNKCKFIINNKIINDNLIAENDHPYYIKDYKFKKSLLSQFSNRFFLLNLDEFDELKICIYLGKLKDLIIEEIKVLSSQTPLFTFHDFLSGKECKYRLISELISNVEDAQEIYNWQSDALIKIVCFEVELLIRKHQEHCSTHNDPINFIQTQIEIIEEGFKESVKDVEKIKGILFDLFAFKDVDVESYSNELLLLNYPSFFNSIDEFKYISPLTINEGLERLKSNSFKLLSNEYVLFYSLRAFMFWLKDIINGRPIQELFIYPIWSDCVKQVIVDAKEIVIDLKKNITNYAYNPVNSKKKVREYLVYEFDKLVRDFNNTEDKLLLSLFTEPFKNILNSHFIKSGLFNTKMYKEDFQNAFVLCEMSRIIPFIYKDIFDDDVVNIESFLGDHIAINEILREMVIDKCSFDEFEDILTDFYVGSPFGLSFDLKFYDQNIKYRKIFRRSLSHLVEVLDTAEISKKLIYIQTRLKDLRYRELNLKVTFNNFKNIEGDNYPNLFKELLSIEADFIRETAQVSPLPFLPAQNKPFFELKEVNSFENFLSKEKQVYILKVLEDLSITHDGIYNLTERKKSALRGVVEALRDCNVLPDIGLDILCTIIAVQINLELKSKLDHSTTSEKFKKDAMQYIIDYPFL